MVIQVQGPATSAVSRPAPATESMLSTGKSTSPVRVFNENSDKASMSALSRQLGESAIRAETRDKALSRSELGTEADRILVSLVDNYEGLKDVHNREVPKTDDPDLLNRAEQATAFLAKRFSGDEGGKSPFSGLSREQLVLIAYDDKGPYTVNERRVAWGDAQKLEFEWGRNTVVQGSLESSVTGKAPKFFTEVLAHYRALPAIEQAQYDEGYETRLLDNIKNDGGLPKQDDHLPNLFEILAGLQRPEKKPEKQPARDAADTVETPAKAKADTPATQAAAAPETATLKTSSLSPDVSPTPAGVRRS
ncbi:hypothetical protein AABC73_02625 [Pseudomonas sp. G.S.17]|uniref:hypothetical protein n=1 Tax=Pseudomonas sp. G.S.17 TaxID=3137451 RepID=UPI00311C9A86